MATIISGPEGTPKRRIYVCTCEEHVQELNGIRSNLIRQFYTSSSNIVRDSLRGEIAEIDEVKSSYRLSRDNPFTSKRSKFREQLVAFKEPENPPKFKETDIVYLKSGLFAPQEHYPCLGSTYEIDCKVVGEPMTQANISLQRNVWAYNLISGRGIHVEGIPEDYLVLPSERHLHKNVKFKILLEDTELAPKDTVFILVNGYYSNDKLGIYLAEEIINDKLKHFFK